MACEARRPKFQTPAQVPGFVVDKHGSERISDLVLLCPSHHGTFLIVINIMLRSAATVVGMATGHRQLSSTKSVVILCNLFPSQLRLDEAFNGYTVLEGHFIFCACGICAEPMIFFMASPWLEAAPWKRSTPKHYRSLELQKCFSTRLTSCSPVFLATLVMSFHILPNPSCCRGKSGKY